MSTNAHVDRIICPKCEKRFGTADSLAQHMKRTRHDRVVRPLTEDEIAERRAQTIHQSRMRAQKGDQ